LHNGEEFAGPAARREELQDAPGLDCRRVADRRQVGGT